MKTITLLLDGIGDRIYEELNFKTPLEYGKTPNLDKLCSIAQCGMMTPLYPGVEVGTELAHFVMFGYRLNEYPGRAVIDALGENKKIDSDEIILRTSWANVEYMDGFFIKDRFVKELEMSSAIELSKSLISEIDGYKFRWEYSYDSHGFLFISGNSISSKVSDSDPFYNNQYAMVVEPFEDNGLFSKKTADALNKFLVGNYENLRNSHINEDRILNGLAPANFLLTKWAGVDKFLEPFIERNGMKAAIIGKSNLLKGISKKLGIEYFEEENFGEAIKLAMQLENFEYVHVHTKRPDEAAHKKDPFKKVEVIEIIDSMIEPIFDFENGLLVVTGDHSTPSSGKAIHSGDDVPIMFVGKNLRVDGIKSYGERSCSKGSIKISGKDFIPMILNFSDRTKLFHLRAGKHGRLYRPETVNVLKRY